jgi:hypothetical protein
MVYVKDLRRMQNLPERVLKHTAVASFDLALRCLHELQRRQSIAAEMRGFVQTTSGSAIFTLRPSSDSLPLMPNGSIRAGSEPATTLS